ncbi:hypothetical protein [Hwanghaeella sp. LZ110]|uniref:hypothetical protein n=1 Tax=Hwanghaeella sp. LZ110 TaxID=3402810 RepID=UPI003B677DE5
MALFGLLMTAMPIARAQVQLFPSLQGGTQNQPNSQNPDQPSANPEPTAPSGMAVETLGAVDTEAVGALPDSVAALPPDLWSGLSRNTIAALINGLNGNGDYPVARGLAKRLLLSAAALPPQDSGTQVSVLKARIEALARLGFAGDAGMLARAGADALRDPDGLAAVARAQLAAYDLPEACSTASNAVAQSNDVFWQKLIAFCQAVAGQKDQASLAAQTLFDTGVKDPVYFTLMDSITLGLAPELKALTPEGAMHYAMLRFSGAPVPFGSTDPLITQLAVQQASDLDVAESAARRGLLSSEALADKYLSEAFKSAALDAPLEALDKISPAAGRALLYQVLLKWEIPALRAEAVSVALTRARSDGLLIAIAPVFATPAMTIPPSNDLLWFAEDAARLFYMTGHTDRARQWHALLRSHATTNADSAASNARLWHLAMLSGETGQALGQSRRDWDRAIIDGAEDPDAGRAHLETLKALVQAATGGEPLASEADLRADAMAAHPETGIGAAALPLHLLTRAAEARRMGEVVALSIAVLSTGPAQDLNPSTPIAVVRALTTVGLQRDARQLALETAVLSAPSPVPMDR